MRAEIDIKIIVAYLSSVAAPCLAVAVLVGKCVLPDGVGQTFCVVRAAYAEDIGYVACNGYVAVYVKRVQGYMIWLGGIAPSERTEIFTFVSRRPLTAIVKVYVLGYRHFYLIYSYLMGVAGRSVPFEKVGIRVDFAAETLLLIPFFFCQCAYLIHCAAAICGFVDVGVVYWENTEQIHFCVFPFETQRTCYRFVAESLCAVGDGVQFKTTFVIQRVPLTVVVGLRKCRKNN